MFSCIHKHRLPIFTYYKLKVKGIGFSKEWENEKVKEYFIETRCIDEYYVSLATEEKISVEIEWFTGNGKEVKKYD